MADDSANLLTLLKTIASEQNYSNPDIKISPISTGGANYSSRLYLINLSSDGKEDLRLFAKIAAIGEKMREMSALEPYDCERFMYTQLIKIYRKLEEESKLEEKHQLTVPKFYGADATRLQEILVLEDLSCQGYKLHNRTESVSFEYATAVITELAKFHALSLAFQHNDPVKFDKVSNMFKKGMFRDHEDNRAFYNSSAKSAMGAVREENKDKLQRFLDGTNLAGYSSMFSALRCPVLIHADFRPSNMLYRYSKDGKLEVMPVDYQSIQAGCPVIDLLCFIYTGTDGQFRAQHYQEVVDHYHFELGAALARLGLDVEMKYSRETFDFELREKLSFGLHLTVLCLPVLLISEEQAPSLDSEFTMASLAVPPSGALYATRLNEVVDEFVAWGVLV